VQPKKNATRVATKRKPSKRMLGGGAPEQAGVDGDEGPSLAALYADLSVTSRIASISRELRDDGHWNEAAVLDQLEAALSGDSGASVIVVKMAKLTKPKGAAGPKKKGHPRKTATSIFDKVHQQVALWQDRGVDDVRIAKAVVAVFEEWLAPSIKAAALLADDSKLAKLADADSVKFVKSVHRALGHPGTDSLDAAARMQLSRARKREKAARMARRAS
jgi:hypothetical protein